jgi:hypothetical protein
MIKGTMVLQQEPLWSPSCPTAAASVEGQEMCARR